ncbi:MAG: sarcosine oxidase subunit delta [Chloroflexota bacterium]
MLQITCPYCGARPESEFAYGGPAHLVRPPLEADVSDMEWSDYLHFRDNPRGPFAESWCHTFGCMEWFNVLRHTVTHQVLRVYRVGDQSQVGEHS